jgi:hypothetical protein
MRFRKLRIAWSVTCGIACVLLIVLWVRSYLRFDNCAGLCGAKVLFIMSSRGDLGIGRLTPPGQGYPPWNITSSPPEAKRLWWPMEDRLPLSLLGIRYQRFSPAMTLFAIRYWLPVLITAVFAGGPWIVRTTRFSLRTLLIATTLVAVVLGLIMWVVGMPRKPSFGSSPIPVRVQRPFTITFSK